MILERYLHPDIVKKNDDAIVELENGSKKTHWVWYVFPQLHGLGYSQLCKEYEFKDIEEANEFYKNMELRNRLMSAFIMSLKHRDKSLFDIFEHVDIQKYVSCATLFKNISKMNGDKEFENLMSKALNWASDEEFYLCEYTQQEFNEYILFKEYEEELKNICV